jgi:methanogenic corrinoid protein MtbC1
VLRAWERRYGIVAPARTASGYRVYDDAAIARIQSMRRLVDDGWSPSAAAAAVIDGTAPVRQATAANGNGGASLGSSIVDLREAFVDAAGALDADGIEVLLDEMFSRGSFERMADEHLMPAVVALGDAWASGRIDVAAEHLASHAVLRRLAAAFQAAGRPNTESGAILVGLPPGSRHELGGLAFAVAARRAGLPILYLGPDLPIDDWVATTERVGARAGVIGSVTPGDRPAAQRVASALLAAQPGLLIAFGGKHPPGQSVEAAMASGGSAPVGLPLRLPADLSAAVDALRRELERPRPINRARSRGSGG